MPTLKGTFPHAALRRPDAVYADKEVECKPPRTDFVVSVDAPLKHKRRALLSEAEYAKVSDFIESLLDFECLNAKMASNYRFLLFL